MGCSGSTPAADMAKEGAQIASQSVKVASDNIKRVFREPSITVQRMNLPGNLKEMSNRAKDAAHHVKNVFAQPLADLESYKTPVHNKTKEERALIEKALKGNFVFEHLSPREMNPLVLAFEKVSVPEGEVIIKQGDEGDHFYVLETGKVAFEVDGEKVGETTGGNSFGELALLCT